MDVERVDDVPEEIERGRPRVAEEVVIPLVGFDEGVDRLPGRAGDDASGGAKGLQQLLNNANKL